MKIYNCDQMSDEWFSVKAGIPSAGSLDRIITTKGEPSKQRDEYLNQLVGEKLLGSKQQTYQSPAMERGVELENEARCLYSFHEGVDVQQVGFCVHDNGLLGCSPDGIVAGMSGFEAKCPLIHTHIGYLRAGKLPTKYYQQVQGSLYVTGFATWDFMSYFPGIKPLIITIHREDAFIRKLHDELVVFNHELKEIVEKLS